MNTIQELKSRAADEISKRNFAEAIEVRIFIFTIIITIQLSFRCRSTRQLLLMLMQHVLIMKYLNSTLLVHYTMSLPVIMKVKYFEIVFYNPNFYLFFF
jgi:hypothetical protein